ncbi:MAG: MBL fold metallo-hydrolase [Proteobacteria bacterium]|nr:MBL fold metallo-hydrolase [Pseudomonadota bacterium]MBU2227745.1 MBL fold metallo-hydrolase [Pseudomonadota bacterium]MBU2261468.1 MBL fold metallo-hydrolase [Pseudomonadota bacterium]
MYMLKVKQFHYSADNLGYLVYGKESGMAVDGGAAAEILAFLAERRLSLLYVANTHGHWDHTSGNAALLNAARARLLTGADLTDGGGIALEGEIIRVIHTPGHTEDSRSFHTGEVLIAGDTLFNGTIGNCFSGDLKGFYRSIRKLMALPAETIVYAGHDYVMDSLAFARRLEPENAEIDAYFARYDPNHVFSTLADERKINPYLRFNEPGIAALLERMGLPRETEWERWRSLMSIE